MPGYFDDLVPSGKQPAAPAAPAAAGGSYFGDLIPPAPAEKPSAVASILGNVVDNVKQGAQSLAGFKVGAGWDTPIDIKPDAGPGIMADADGLPAGPVSPASARLQRQVDAVGPGQVSRNPAEPTVSPVRGQAPTIGNMLSDLYGTLPQSGEAMRQGTRALFADAAGLPGMAADAQRRASQVGLDDAVSTPAFESPTLRGVYGGVKSAVQTAPLIAASLANPAVGLTAMGAQSGLSKYGELRAEDVEPIKALGAAAATGTIESGTEMFALAKLAKLFGRPGFRTLGGLLAAEIPGEQIATLGVDLFDAVVSKDPNAIAQFKATRGEAAYNTLIATLTQTALMGGAAKLANAAIGPQEQPQAPTLRDMTEAFGFRSTPSTLPAAPPSTQTPGSPPPPLASSGDGAQPEGSTQDIAQLLAAIQQSTPGVENDGVPGPVDMGDVRGRPGDGQTGDPVAALERSVEGGEGDRAGQAGPGVDQQVPAVPRPDQPDGALTQNVGSPAQVPTESNAPDAPVLQNRNRASAASIKQMNAIAAAPDPARLSFSREFATGAPVVFSEGDAATIPAERLGRTDTITDANGKKYQVQYAVIEAGDALTSNRADGTPVKMYELRNSGLIKTVAGNARMAGLQAAYERETVGPYLEGIAGDQALHGVNPAVLQGMQQPVLVRVMRSQDVTGNIGDVSNQSGVSALNATEQAQTDAGRVDFAALEFDDNGQPTVQAVENFVRNMPAAEQGGLLIGKGQPSRQASERLMAATFARAYNDPTLIELYAQATDPEARTVLSGLAQAAGSMAKLEGTEGLDIRPLVVEAAQQAVNAARRGVSIAKLAQQRDMTTAPETQQVLEFLAANVRSAKRIGEGLRAAADFAFAESTKDGTDMFGAVARATKSDVLERIGNETQPSQAVGEPAGAAPYAANAAGPGQQGTGGPVRAVAGQAQAGQVLTNPTPDELRRRALEQQRAEREAKQNENAPPPEEFRLTGSNRQADQAEAAGQTSLFERDRRDTQTPDLFAAPASATPDQAAGRQRAATGSPGPAGGVRGSGRTVSTVVAKPIEGAEKPRPRVLYKSVADQFAQEKTLALVGLEVRGPEDIAQAAQIYRDPRYETFRFILTKGGKVVHEEAVSSRMPRETDFVPAGKTAAEYLAHIRAAMKKYGADGYWMMHNHPSGVPSASDADVKCTAFIEERLPGFQGHVIINSGQFGYLKPAMRNGKRVAGYGIGVVELNNYPGDAILRRENLPGWMYATVEGPRDVAVLGKGLQRPGHIAVLGVNANRIRMAAEIPAKMLDDPIKAAAWFRRLGITGGGGELMLYSKNRDDYAEYAETLDQLHSAGYISDVVYGNGQSITGVSGRRAEFGKTTAASAREVHEELPQYGDQTPATQKLWHEGDENLPTLDRLTPAQRAIYDQVGKAPAEGKFALKTQAERDIEERARIKIAVKGWDEIERQYDALPETEGGKVLNTDTARELFNDYLADRTQAAAVHEPASDAIKELFKRKLARGPQAGQVNVVLFTAGGTGAGKSSGFKQFKDAAYLKEQAFLIYDTNVADAAKGIQKMTQAMKAGNNVYLMHTVRDPIEALTLGALKRAESQAELFGSGRTVPLAEHVKTHAESNRAVLDVIKHFEGNPGFGHSIVDNRYGIGGQRYIDKVQIPQYNAEELEPRAKQALDDAYANGKISEATYRGFAGREAALPRRVQGVAGAAKARVPGQPEGERQEGRPDAVAERGTPYGRDLEDQAEWLNEKAKAAGFKDIDALAQSDPQKFIALAVEWRNDHPTEVNEAAAPYGAAPREPREPLIDPVTGRLKAGEAAYAAVDKYIGGLFRKIGLASNAPPELRRLLQRFRADQEKAKQSAVDILEASEKIPEAERELLSAMIEKELPAGVVPPQHLQLIAQQIDAAINRQTKQLLDLGMITPEQAKHWEGRYLARYYAKDIDPETGKAIPLWKRALRIGIKAQHSKSRGLIEVVPADQVEAFRAKGFTVMRGADTQDPNLVAMWRDFTKAERERMGEVRDAAYRFARGTLETGADIAAARIFASIANSELATKSSVVANQRGWRQVPDVAIPGTLMKRFGKLSGMYVPEAVWKELAFTFRDRGAFEQGMAELMALWKEGKTAMNPATHAANVASNIMMADIAGVSPIFGLPKYVQALRDIRAKGKYTREAIGEGLMEGGNAVDELREWLPDPGEVLAHKGPRGIQALFETRAAQVIGKYSGASWYRKHMRNLYGAEDAFFKLLIFTHYRERGMSAEQAAVEANRYIFDYRDLPPMVQQIRNFAIPFISYTYKAIPAITHAWLTRPWIMAKYAAIFNGINALSYALGGDDDEEYERRMMPSYMKGWSPLGFPSHIRVFDDKAGNPQFVNAGRLTPLGTLFQTTNGEGFALPQAFVPSHPLLQAMITLTWNVDTLTGKEFFKPSDDARDRTVKAARYLVQQFAPAMPLVPGSYGFEKLANGAAATFDAPVDIPSLGINYTGQTKYGQEESLARAAAQTLIGVNVRGFDPDRQERFESLAIRKEIQEINGNLRAINRDQSLGPETKRARIEREQAKRAKLVEKLGAVGQAD